MDEIRAWHRLAGEPNRWYQRFKRFCRLGPGRSVLRVYTTEMAEKSSGKRGKLPGAWNAAVRAWRWYQRAEAFDAYIDQKEDREWERRRQQHRRKEMELSQLLIEKAEQMLQFPLATTSKETREAGGNTINVTTIEATRWALRDAAGIIKVADELARLGLGMSTNQTTAVVGEMEKLGNVEELSDEQLQQIISASVLPEEGEGAD